MEVRTANEVKLSELLFEPTPLAHIWTTIILLSTFHVISARSGVDLGASLFIGVAFGYLLLTLPPFQFIFGWRRPSRVSIPIFLSCSAIFSALIYFLDNNLPNTAPGISTSLSLIFPIVALGRGFLLLSGFMGKAIISKPNVFMKIISGNVWFFLVLRVILLSFLVWWFGFSARNPVDSDPLSMFYWSTLFVAMLFIGHKIQSKNSMIGGGSSVGTRSFSAISVLLLDWSMVSSMRMLDEGAVASTMFEELAMFIFVIAMVLWTRTNKTPDPKITSAALSIGFAYVVFYAGSISQMSLATELNISAVLGIGHGLTSIVIFVLVFPMSIRIEKSLSNGSIQSTNHSDYSESTDQPI
ncbi:MAG: hypothetical protein VYD21_02855 [Candidatus Thermoplasmatota archaeon]|nr:hypothetical protein [Candidatus Thermoplasmatota archaeon]